MATKNSINSGASSTELNYVIGVTSSIQTQINAKLNSSAVSSYGLTLIDDVDAATARTTLGLGTLATQSGTFSGTSSGTNTGDQTITLTGNVTGSGTGSFVTTIASNVVANSMLSTVATATFKGRTTAGTGNVEDLTATQATALLNSFVGDSGSGGTKGLVPAPATGDSTKFLKGDGTWASPAGSGDMVLASTQTVTGAKTFNAGKLLDKGSIVFDIRAYGATVDGTTNDQTAVQAAIDAANTAGGGIVFFPAGTTMVQNLTMYGSVTLRGVSDGGDFPSMIKRHASSTAASPLIEMSGSATGYANHLNNSAIENLVLHGGDTAGNIVRCFYVSKCHFRNVYFIGCSLPGFHGVEFWDSRFYDCRWEFCGDDTHASVLLENAAATSGFGASADNCNQIFFDGCVWEANNAINLDLAAATHSSTNTINGIYLNNCKFESDYFRDPFIRADANSTFIFGKNIYLTANSWPGGYAGGAKDMIEISGAYTSWNNLFFAHNNTASSGINFNTSASANHLVLGAFANWNGNPVPTVLIDSGVSSNIDLTLISIGTSDSYTTPVVDNSGYYMWPNNIGMDLAGERAINYFF